MAYTIDNLLENRKEQGIAIALREDFAATQLRHPWIAQMYAAMLRPFLKFERYSEVVSSQENQERRRNPLLLYTSK